MAFAAAAIFITSHSQVIGQEGEGPEQQDHWMGFVQESPSVTRGLPRVARFRAFLPLEVDLSSKLPLPGDQGRLGSCSSWAVAYAARSYYTTIYEKRSNRNVSNIPSPLYTWQLAHTGACDKGSSFNDVVGVLAAGALSMKAYPYRSFCTRPSAAQIASAKDFRVRGLSTLDETNPDDLRGELAKGNPVLFALQVGSGWAYDRKTQGVRNGYLIEGSDRGAGGDKHAMTMIGYDDRRQAFRVINSWGRRWGDHGYAWMSYDFVRNHRVVEARVLDVDPPLPPPTPKNLPTPSPTPKSTPPSPWPRPTDINALKCSSVHVVRKNGRPVVSGFVGSSSDLEAVRAAYTMAAATIDVRVLPFPLCEAALTLEKPMTQADKPIIDTGGRSRFRGGDTLVFKVRSTQSVRYLYVLYVSHDGDVQVLSQPRGVVPSQSASQETHVFGDGANGRQRFTVSAPFGDEMIVALASKSPLFDEPLPAEQKERTFLSLLRRQLVFKPDPSLPDRDVSASIATLVTAKEE